MPDSFSSGGEEDTDTVVEAEQLMAETVGAVAETEELAAEWMSCDGKMMWFYTAEETLHCNPVPTSITPGSTLYAVACISSLRSAFGLFITGEIIQLLCTHTNLHLRHVDEVEMKAYIRILIRWLKT